MGLGLFSSPHSISLASSSSSSSSASTSLAWQVWAASWRGKRDKDWQAEYAAHDLPSTLARRFVSHRWLMDEAMRAMRKVHSVQSTFVERTIQKAQHFGQAITLHSSEIVRNHLTRITMVQLLISSCLTILLFVLVASLIVRSRTHKRISAVYGVGKDAQDEKDLDAFQDSDEYEFDDEEEESGGRKRAVGNGAVHRLRSLTRSARSSRTASQDSFLKRRRPSNIVRITSSDPLSRLSIQAFQMDLDPMNYLSAERHPSISSTDGSPGPPTRRRKESGRLLAGLAEGTAPAPPTSAPEPPATSSASANTTSNPSVHVVRSAGRISKDRRTGSRTRGTTAHERRINRSDSASRQAERASSVESYRPESPGSEDSFLSAFSGGHGFEEGSKRTAQTGLASILQREPRFYASLPVLPTFTSVVDGDAGNISDGALASPLRHPLSSGSDEDTYTASPPPVLPQSHRPGRLPPGAAHAPGSPLSKALPPLRLGTLSPEQMRTLWPEKRARKVKLKEPDWRPYVDVHERARERLEKYAEVRASSPSSPQRTASPLPVSTLPVSDDENPFLEEGDEEAFWYERFTQSTAAAGRDWDWRKRRARRLAALRASSLLRHGIDPRLPSDPAKVLPSLPQDHLSSAMDKTQEGARSATHTLNGRPPTQGNDSWSEGVLSLLDEKDTSSNVLPSQTHLTDPNPVYVVDDSAHLTTDADAKDDQTDLSVPGRLSSLKPKGVKKILSTRREKSNVRSSPEMKSSVQVKGWSIEPDLSALELTAKGSSSNDEPVERSPGRQSAVRKSEPLASMTGSVAVAGSTPTSSRIATRAARSNPPRQEETFLSQLGSGPNAFPWQDGQIWSSADAYGATSSPAPPLHRSHGARSNSLFARPTGELPILSNGAPITHDLTGVYGGMPAHDPVGGRNGVRRRRETDTTLHPSSVRQTSPAIEPDRHSPLIQRTYSQPMLAAPPVSSRYRSPSPSRRNILASTREASPF